MISKFSYVIVSKYGIVSHLFEDYHEMIMMIRRRKIDGSKIYRCEVDSWNEFESPSDISKIVYSNAYNDFDHYRDKNYEQTV
jgi:hypothetical protein